MKTKPQIDPKRKKMIAGLEQLEFAVRGIAVQHTGDVANLLQILAGTIGWEVRNAKDSPPDCAKVTADRVRRAFGEPAAWGTTRPIGKALLKIYGW